MRLPFGYQPRAPHPDIEANRPKETRTWAQRELLLKRHAPRKKAWVQTMVNDRVMTKVEAEHQYDVLFMWGLK